MDKCISTIKKKIRDYIEQETLLDHSKISDESLLFREGLLDSMGFIKILTYIQETFGTDTHDADLIEENFESINAIANFIHVKIKNR